MTNFRVKVAKGSVIVQPTLLEQDQKWSTQKHANAIVSGSGILNFVAAAMHQKKHRERNILDGTAVHTSDSCGIPAYLHQMDFAMHSTISVVTPRRVKSFTPPYSLSLLLGMSLLQVFLPFLVSEQRVIESRAQELFRHNSCCLWPKSWRLQPCKRNASAFLGGLSIWFQP